MVANRPTEHVSDEISIIMGFPIKPGTAKATVGSNKFELLPKGSNLWPKNSSDQSRMLRALQAGGYLTVYAASDAGTFTTDFYLLSGIDKAIERANRECE